MLGRPDPFFNHKAPHKKNFLEAMHRQYGVPQQGLPPRNDEMFKKAFAFREHEKSKYREMEDVNTRLRRENQQLTADTYAIRDLLTKFSSKVSVIKDAESSVGHRKEHTSIGHSDDEAGVYTRKPRDDGDNDGVGVIAKGSDAARGGVRVSTDDKHKRCEKGGTGRMRREVLPTVVPSVGGSSSEHIDEGPEPGDGPGSTRDGGGDGSDGEAGGGGE